MMKNEAGRWGESLAAAYLRKKGYNIVAANYRSRFGEIDLIAENRRTLVFVEVKLRSSAQFALPREYVTAGKQTRLRQTAMLYLAALECDTRPARFDVIEIYAPQGMATKKPIIRHLEDAFQ